MRTLITGARAVISAAAGHWCFAYLEVTNDAGTFTNVAALAGSEGTNDYLVTAQVADSVDANTITFSAVLKRDVRTDSLSPFRVDSALNESETTPGTYAPALDLHREWRIMVAVTARGTTPGPADYREMAAGRVDKITVDGLAGTITIEGRGLEADLLDAFVVEDREYVSHDMEDVIQLALDDQMGVDVVPLYTPVTPDFLVADTIGDINLMPALSDIAALAGFTLRYRYDASDDNRFTLFEPPRDSTTADWSIASTEYEDLAAAIDLSNVRNYIKVRFTDTTGLLTTVTSPGAESGTVTCVSQSATFSADQSAVLEDGAIIVVNDVGYTVSAFNGTTTCTLVGAPDFTAETFYTSASITRYGLRPFVIDLAATSQITDASAAGSLADAVRSDLEDPALTQSFKAPGLWFVQLHDVVTTTANGVHYSEDQTGGVVSYSHSFANGMLETTVGLAGHPRGRYTTWKRIGSGTSATTETTAAGVTALSATWKEYLVASFYSTGVVATATVNEFTNSVKYELSATLDFATVLSTAYAAVTTGTAWMGFFGSGIITAGQIYYVRATGYTGPLASPAPSGPTTGVAGAFVVANTSNIPAPEDTDTVTWDLDESGKWKANVVGLADVIDTVDDLTTVSGSVGGKEVFVNIEEDDAGTHGLLLSTIPTAEVEVGTPYRRQRYLVGAGSVRLNANIKTLTGTPSIRLHYTTNSFGSTVPILSWVPSGTGLRSSAWYAMPTAAKADVGLTVCVGDGADTGVLNLYELDAEFRSTDAAAALAAVRADGVSTVAVTGSVIGGAVGGTVWDDDFITGSVLDTTGSRFASAKAWTKLTPGITDYTVASGKLTISIHSSDVETAGATMGTLPAGDWTFETKVTSTIAGQSFAGAYIFLRDSASHRMLLHGIGYDFGYKAQVRVFNTTNWAANYGGGSAPAVPVWLDLARIGTNLRFRYSTDGLAWTTVATVAESTDFPSASPDLVGLMGWHSTGIAPGTEDLVFEYFHKTA